MNNAVMFSSARLDWQTPREVIRSLEQEFGMLCDPCPSNHTFDGLKVEWGPVNFVNPPYGRKIGAWIKKGFEEAQKGKTVIFLIPSRTDTAWWQDYIMKAQEIRFIRGRLKFGDSKNGAPFPSAIAIFKRGEAP